MWIFDPLNLRAFICSSQLLHFTIEKRMEAGRFLQLGQHDWLNRLILIVHARTYGDFVAELFAKLLDGRNGVIQAWTSRLMTIREPVAQRRVLLNPLFDNPIGFGNGGAE